MRLHLNRLTCGQAGEVDLQASRRRACSRTSRSAIAAGASVRSPTPSWRLTSNHANATAAAAATATTISAKTDVIATTIPAPPAARPEEDEAGDDDEEPRCPGARPGVGAGEEGQDGDRDQPERDEAGGMFAALREDVLGHRAVIALLRDDEDRGEVDEDPGAAEQRQDDEARAGRRRGRCRSSLPSPPLTPASILSLRLRSRRLTIGVWSVCSLMSRGCLGRDAVAIRNHPGPTLNATLVRRDVREDDRREPPGAARLPAPRAGRGGPRADRDRGQVAAGRADDDGAGVRRHPRGRGVAERARDLGLRAGEPREPRADARRGSCSSIAGRSTRCTAWCARRG